MDSVLIDEARTPLIISGGVMQNVNLFDRADMFVKGLDENEDYIKDDFTYGEVKKFIKRIQKETGILLDEAQLWNEVRDK